MNWALLAVLAATAGGGVTIGALFGPFRDKVHRQTYCVVRVYRRPEGYETLFESRLPKTSQRYLAAHQDGTLTVMLKTEVDKANADSMRKRAWWNDFRAMMDALVTLRQQQARGMDRDHLSEIEEMQTQILRRLDTLTGPIPVMHSVSAQEFDDAAMERLKEQFRNTVGGRQIWLGEEPQIREYDGGPIFPGETTSMLSYGNEPSVMPAMDPTEAIDKVALEHAVGEIKEAGKRPPYGATIASNIGRLRAGVASPYHFQADPVPTEATGIGKAPNATRTVVLPLGDAGLLKEPGDTVGGEQ